MSDSADKPPARLPRRRIAYASCGGLLAEIPVAALVELTTPQADVLIAIAYCLAFAVGAYMGAQVAPDVFRRG